MNNFHYPELKLDPDYFDFMDLISVLEKQHLINTKVSAYLPNYIVGSYIRWQLDSEHNWKAYNNMDSLLIDRIFKYSDKDKLLSQMLLNEYMNWKLEELDTTLYNKYLPIIDKEITEPFLRDPLIEQYSEAKAALTEAKISSSAILIDYQGSDVNSLMDSIKNKSKDKIIYIDVWATWCGPCLSNMPNSKRLQEELLDEPVDFVYICVSSEVSRWKSFISKFGLAGFHYYLNENQSEDFRDIRNSNILPQYILIDKQGKIIDNSNLRPDEARLKIRELIE